MQFKFGDGSQSPQRLRIGLLGLLLVGSLTAVVDVLVKGSEAPATEDAVLAGANDTLEKVTGENEAGQTEPLAELGVVPDLPATEETKGKEKLVVPAEGQIVPDLKPKSDIANDE